MVARGLIVCAARASRGTGALGVRAATSASPLAMGNQG
jgi:hypothetical protein